MKKSPKILHWFNMGIFPGTLMVSCGFTYDEIIKLLKKKKADSWAMAIEGDRKLIEDSTWLAAARYLTNIKTNKQVQHYLIVIKDQFDFSDESFCKLAHEVLHICQYFLPDVLDRTKEHEAEAYLHTYIMKQIVASLRNKK